MKQDVIFVLKAIVGVTAAFYIGAMFNFFLPFFGKDIIVKEIGFCTLIICTVMAICTRIILNAIRKGKPPIEEKCDAPSPIKDGSSHQ